LGQANREFLLKTVDSGASMSQAEIAGGKVSPKGELPRTGYRLRDFVLKTTDELEVRLSDYRGRCNLILIFNSRSTGCVALLHDLASQHSSLRGQQAEVLVITPSDLRNDLPQLPFAVLFDTERTVHGDYGLQSDSDSVSGIFIADRFGELTASYVGLEVANATSASVLKWLEFINSQCPECEPPEWPLED
jgi:peroxiredoxin